MLLVSAIALVAFVIGLLLAVSRLGKWCFPNFKEIPKPASIEKIAVEDFYDDTSMGCKEVLTGQKHVFPLCLVQQIDVGIEPSRGEQLVTLYVTAEFNYAEFNFDQSSADAFVCTMEKSLPSFDGVHARARISEALTSGQGATIYVSPNYPDAEIIEKFRAA